MKLRSFKANFTLYMLISISLVSNSISAQNCTIDPLAQPSTPTSRFIDNNDGTITDTKTQLMWKKCLDGQTGSQCNEGSALTYTWQNALQRVKSINDTIGFANYVDWRMPNIKEIYSLVERTCVYPAINLTVFPNDISGLEDISWSSTPYVYTYFTDRTMSVSFYRGDTNAMHRSENGLLRLVRTIPE